MEEQALNFIYINARNTISVQSIVNGSHNDTYIQGISILDNEQGRLKTYRKDRLLAFFDTYEEAINNLDKVSKTIDTSIYTIRKIKPATFDIHFTGFKKDTKNQLEELATSTGMSVKKSVTKGLKLLCYGYNASHKKIDTAREMGIIILNEELFKQFIETGDFTDSI